MKNNLFTKIVIFALAVLPLGLILSATAQAEEVDKGKIPEEQLASSFKQLSWGSPIWDVPEAVDHLKTGGDILWVDTRPESFFTKGTVAGAVLLIYNKKGMAENTLTPESLEKAIADAGLAKDSVKIVFFCQGPKCHRSYNAAFVSVTEWGYSPEQVIWFRDGYPNLLSAVKADPKLKRKAKKYLSEAGVKQL